MAKLIVFNSIDFSGGSKEYRSNDPDLSINGNDFILASAISIEGDWTLYADVNHTGDTIDLNAEGGPDFDGVYKDPADWSGTAEFHVKSIQYSEN